MKIIILRRWFLALSVLTVLLSISPASAHFCKVKNTPSFASVVIGSLVSGAKSPLSTKAEIDYECPLPASIRVALICAYIEPVDPTERGNGNLFYQGQDGNDSRLAWRGKFSSVDFARDEVGALKIEKQGKISNGTMDLKADYLPRANQDKVRAGRYTSTYNLVSLTILDPEDRDCPGVSERDAYPMRVTTPFQLQADVLTTCQLENKGEKQDTFDPIDFGTRGALSAANAGAGAIRATTNIDVRCTYETPYTLDLDNGKNFDGGTRRMKNGDNFLAYQLFNKSASGESSPWSKLSGIGNTVNAVNKHTVEGQLTTPIAIAPAAGSYADTVVVTLTF